MTIKYTSIIRAAILSCAALSANALAAWPEDKPIELVVGFAAGGGNGCIGKDTSPLFTKTPFR